MCTHSHIFRGRVAYVIPTAWLSINPSTNIAKKLEETLLLSCVSISHQREMNEICLAFRLGFIYITDFFPTFLYISFFVLCILFSNLFLVHLFCDFLYYFPSYDFCHASHQKSLDVARQRVTIILTFNLFTYFTAHFKRYTEVKSLPE